MHAFNVNFEFLRLAELPPTEVTQRSGALWIGCTAIRSMHLQVVKTQEELHKQQVCNRQMNHIAETKIN